MKTYTLIFMLFLFTTIDAQVAVNTDGTSPHSFCHAGCEIHKQGPASTQDDDCPAKCHRFTGRRTGDIQHR